MNKIGINFSNYFGNTVDDNFNILSQIGFETVFTDYIDDKSTQMFANLAQKNGLLYESMHAPFDKINDIWYEGENGDKMIDRICDCVKACGRFNIPVAVVHLSSGVKPPLINEVGYLRLNKLVDTAVKNNVTVAFENQRKIANLAFVLETFSDVDNVKFCWDMGHEVCFSQGIEFMPLFGNKLGYTHIHDNFSEFNRDLHLIPFDGNIDFNKNAEYLKKYNYTGTLTLEIIPQHSNMYNQISVEDYYRKAYSAVEKLRDMIIKNNY